VHDEAASRLNVLAVNRSLDQELDVLVDARNFGALEPAVALTMSDDDLDAANTKEAPNRVQPAELAGVKADGGKVALRLRPASWNVVSLAVAR
jgi:alpha-N-arabinofuranosidase